MSPELRKALTEWLAEAESDAPCKAVQDRGLCYWLVAHGLAPHKELSHLLPPGTEYPFDFGEPEVYLKDKAKHKNPRRLAWVRQQLGA